MGVYSGQREPVLGGPASRGWSPRTGLLVKDALGFDRPGGILFLSFLSLSLTKYFSVPRM